jgi:hypothetical protein
MKYFRLPWLSILLITFCFLLFWSSGAAAEQKEENNVCFCWAFGAMVGSENDRRLVAITRDTTLKTGDQIKLLVELKKKCFVYLIYHSGQNELHMLFPYELPEFSKDPETRKKYYIPQGTKWFELDEKTGLETFYLLASAERLSGLEELMKKYICASQSDKQRLVKEVLAEIQKTKRRHRTLTAPAERPVSIGGSVRGIGKEKKSSLPDIDPIAEEVSAINFYSRTFTIDHR